MKSRAVFLDRDGTLNRDVGYPSDYSQVHLYRFSPEAVRAIRRLGFRPVVVTNQSGVGRGLIPEPALREIHRRLGAELERRGARLDGIYYCPHYLRSSEPRYRKDCSCRKPKPGLARRAAADLNLDLRGSYMIGDKVEDIRFGLAIGATPILVLTGYGRRSLARLRGERFAPAHVAQNLGAAVRWIARREVSARTGEE
jgi:D-glycero-D-manno-heptose 1,7-bisphosphate phosphatase